MHTHTFCASSNYTPRLLEGPFEVFLLKARTLGGSDQFVFMFQVRIKVVSSVGAVATNVADKTFFLRVYPGVSLQQPPGRKALPTHGTVQVGTPAKTNWRGPHDNLKHTS